MFEKNIFIENIKKSWLIILILTILIFILVPANIAISKNSILEKQQYMEQLGTKLSDDYILKLSNSYTTNAIESKLFTNLNYAIILIIPVFISMQLFTFVRNKEQNTDKKIYITNIITQILIILVPYITNAIVLIMLKLFGGFLDKIDYQTILYWFATNTITSIMVLAIANIVAPLTKNKITHVLTTYGLLFAPIILLVIFEKLLMQVLFGFPGFSDTTLSIIGEIPTAKILNLYVYNYDLQSYTTNFTIPHGVLYIIISFSIMYITYKIKNKNLFKIVQETVKYIITFITMSLCYIATSYSLGVNIKSVIMSLIVAAITYIIIETIIKRTYKIISSWKGIAIYIVISIIFYVVCIQNIFGYQTKIPELEDIEYALYSMTNPSESNKNIYYREKENIQLIMELQKEQIVHKKEKKDYESKKYENFYIHYKLKNGKQITRLYEIEPIYRELYNTEEFIKQRYAYFLNENETENISSLKILGTYDKKIFEINFTKKNNQEEMLQIIEAIKIDLEQNEIYKNEENTYNKYGEKEGIQYITIDVYSELYTSQDYVSYLNIKEEYELVQIIQKLIEEESDIINWKE